VWCFPFVFTIALLFGVVRALVLAASTDPREVSRSRRPFQAA
jgi:hypothetical protein